MKSDELSIERKHKLKKALRKHRERLKNIVKDLHYKDSIFFSNEIMIIFI